MEMTVSGYGVWVQGDKVHRSDSLLVEFAEGTVEAGLGEREPCNFGGVAGALGFFDGEAQLALPVLEGGAADGEDSGVNFVRFGLGVVDGEE
jgi:hypothetical protein